MPPREYEELYSRATGTFSLEDAYYRYERGIVRSYTREAMPVDEGNDAILIDSLLEHLVIDIIDMDTFSNLRQGAHHRSEYDFMLDVIEEADMYFMDREARSSSSAAALVAENSGEEEEELGTEVLLLFTTTTTTTDANSSSNSRAALKNEDVCCFCLENFPDVVFEGCHKKKKKTNPSSSSGVCCYLCARMILERDDGDEVKKCPHCRAVITDFSFC